MAVTKAQNGMEWNGKVNSFPLFSVSFPEAILYRALDPKILNLGIPNPKSKHSLREPDNIEALRVIPFQVLVNSLINLNHKINSKIASNRIW